MSATIKCLPNKKSFWVALMLSVGQTVLCIGDGAEIRFLWTYLMTNLSDDNVVVLRDPKTGVQHKLDVKDITEIHVNQSGITGHSRVTIYHRL